MSCRLVSTLVIDIQNLKHDMTERAKLETWDLSHSVLGLHTKQKGETGGGRRDELLLQIKLQVTETLENISRETERHVSFHVLNVSYLRLWRLQNAKFF